MNTYRYTFSSYESTGANQTQEEIQLDLLQLQSHRLAEPAGGDI